MTENEIATIIVDTAYSIHRDLGPGLFETVYERIMEAELMKRGLKVERQKPIPIVYDGVHFEAGFRCDLLVQDKVIVEVKAIETILPVHEAQLLSYLKLSRKRVGLLINFNVAHLRQGIRRRICGY